MTRTITLATTALLFVLSCGPSFADGWEVDHIWWNLVQNYNHSRWTVCIAENFNNYTVNAVFDIYPAGTDHNGKPAHGKATPKMVPYTMYRLFGWPDGSKPDPACVLKSHSVRVF
jgi:hypothetical protein